MDRSVDLESPVNPGPVSLNVDVGDGAVVQAPGARQAWIGAGSYPQPIQIQINFGNDRGRRRRDETGFSLARSKLFWLVVMFSLSVGMAYARTRYVCQSFRDEGRFYYGMGVDRCVNILIRQPFDQISDQLHTINRSY